MNGNAQASSVKGRVVQNRQPRGNGSAANAGHMQNLNVAARGGGGMEGAAEPPVAAARNSKTNKNLQSSSNPHRIRYTRENKSMTEVAAVCWGRCVGVGVGGNKKGMPKLWYARRVHVQWVSVIRVTNTWQMQR